MAVSVGNAKIEWVNVSFRCGDWNDVRIFRHKIYEKLDKCELIVADGDYSDKSNNNKPKHDTEDAIFTKRLLYDIK